MPATPPPAAPPSNATATPAAPSAKSGAPPPSAATSSADASFVLGSAPESSMAVAYRHPLAFPAIPEPNPGRAGAAMPAGALARATASPDAGETMGLGPCAAGALAAPGAGAAPSPAAGEAACAAAGAAAGDASGGAVPFRFPVYVMSSMRWGPLGPERPKAGAPAAAGGPPVLGAGADASSEGAGADAASCGGSAA